MVEITSKMARIRDTNLCIHQWPKPSSPNSPLVVVFHGFLAHGLYPTVRYAADRLSNAGLAVVSFDSRGHGQSDGLKGYLEGGPQGMIQDAVEIVKYAQEELYPDAPKIVLVGSSMGGTMALCAAHEICTHQDSFNSMLAGVVLLAPMLQLSVNPVLQTVLSGLAIVIPTWQVIPSSSRSLEAQYRDPQKLKECEEDPMGQKGEEKDTSGTIRVGSAWACVELTNHAQTIFRKTSFPILLMVADEDVVVNNEGSEKLFQWSPSKTKTMKRYRALHGLLCEPEPLVTEIENDIVDWVKDQISS